MGAGSSAEQRSPQDGAPQESQPSSPEGRPPTAEEEAAAAAESEQPEEPAKLLQKNGQISSINGITEEQVDLSLKPEELNGQQAEVIITDVGQRETASVILKEESVENMEAKPPESTNKTSGDDDEKDVQDADKQSPSLEEKGEEQEQPSESPSNDVGFKKVFKLVGFKFTVRKDKTEKVEPVQLLNVKADDTEVASDGSGDHKEIKKETVEEAAQIEVPHSLEKTEQETQTEKIKEEISLEKEIESPIEEGGKDAETKNDGSKSPESPTSPLTSETASPLRKFFTQSWAGFRKRTSFRKPKEEEQQGLDKEKQEQERDMTKEEGAIKEELEEKPIPEKAQTDASVEASDEKVEKNREEKEEKKMIDVSTETYQTEVTIPPEHLSRQESAEGVDKKTDISLNEKSDLALVEKSEPGQECLIALKQSTLELSEKKLDPAAPSENEEKTDQSDPATLIATEEPKEHFETVEGGKSEPKAPLATEIFDEKLADANIDLTTIVKKDEPKTIQKEQLVFEQLTEVDTEIQRGQPTDEQLKVKETMPETVSEQLKETEPSILCAATSKPPEGIVNEVELISSQERAKMQGSPLKKLFTSSSLKKLSAKKHKGKREDVKLGEAAEQIQQFSDSAESPEDLRAESSASSPEEAADSVEKVTEGIQVIETEEGSTSDMEKKRESVTPWASFKKMVTPKKRIRRLSESDKEEEPDKAKSATLSSTESAPCEEQEDIKENGEEQKLEKSTDEPKKKVDTSVSWEALICVGSSKKRSRKSSSSDEEVGQRLAQEGQKVDETAPSKETAGEITFTSSQESDQGQGGSSPEQVGSPSEGEGVSTWESFKRLVTARRKSKTKMEERSEEPAVIPSLEYSTSDGESGKEESWVSFKKLMPGRRKKKSDGIPEHAPVQETGEDITETNEEDSDIPAVVPLSEYEAAEQEKLEAQKKNQEDITVKDSDQRTEKSEGTLITEQCSEGLVHAVTVTVVEGERAVTSIEERSPSWISAAVTETVEHADEDEEKQTEHISETGLVEETVVASKLKPEIKKDISGDTIISELELTSEAITAREEASIVEEGPEAEETTEMVSAVSRLSESPDTTEIATPVQDVDESQQNIEELSKQTQEILQEVAERVKLSEEPMVISKITSEVIIQPVSVQKTEQEITVVFQGAELSESLLKEKASERIDIQTNEGIECGQGQVEVKERSLKEVLEKSHDVCVEVKKSSEETTSLNQIDEDHHPKTEQKVLEKPREIAEEEATEEKSEEEEEEDFVIVTVTPEEKPEVTIDDAAGKPLESLKEKDSEEYSKAHSVQEVKMHLEEGTQGKVTEDVQEFKKETCEEKPGFSQKQEEVANVICELEAETTEVEEKKAVKQNDVKESELLIKSSCTDTVVLEAPILSKSIDVSVPDDERKVSGMSMERDAALGLEKGSTQEVTVEAAMQNKVLAEHMKTETHIQKMDPEVQLQELETKKPLVDVTPEPLLVNLETQIHAEMGKEISVRKMDADKEKVEAEDHIQKVETSDHIEEVEGKSHILSVREEVLAEKSELNVDIDISTEKTKTESITEKADVGEHLQETEAHISPEEAHSTLPVESDVEKIEEEMAQPMIAVKSEALKERMEVEDLAEKLKAAAISEKKDVTVHVEAATARIDAKIESEICTDKTDPKVDGKSSTEKADAMVEGETISPPVLTDKNLKEEPASARVDIKPLVEKVGAEVAKEKTEVEAPLVKDIGHSTEEAKADDETHREKTDVEATRENAGAKADLELFEGKTLVKVCEEHSKEMMEAGAATKQLELKETLQKVENDAIVQSVVKDTAATYLATCTEVISAEAPVELVSEQESVVSDMTRVSIQGETQSVATEKSIPQEKGLLEVSTSKQDEVDFTQMVVADASRVLVSQITEGIEAEAQENNELKDITVMKSKSTKESLAEISVQSERVLPAVEEEKILMFLGSIALEGSVQSEEEDALTSESKYCFVNVVEDSVQNEATGDSVKEELSTETESAGTLINKAEVDGGILTSESGYTGSLASNAILENVRDSTPPDDKEASINGISVQINTSPDKLLLETVHPLSATASDSYQRRQALSEKVQIIETEKSSENIELGGGDVLPSAPVEQEIFAEQQEVVTTDFPEVQSYADHKSSITVTATEAEEQVSTEKVTLTETSVETPQSLLEETKETTFQMVQQVSFVHSGLGVPGPHTKAVSEKTDSEAEEPILPAATFTKDDFLQKSGSDPIPEMKLQKSETSRETEKQMTSPARSPSLTHIEFEKDVVQSVTIESQSTKIVLKIIQNAVDKIEKTEETVFSSQQTEPCPLRTDKSEIQEDLQKQEAFKATEELPLSTEKSENGRSSGTRKTAADLEAVKHTSQTDEQPHTLTKLVQDSGSMSEAVKEFIKEESLQKENGEPRLQSVVDTAVPTETQRVTLEGASGSLPKKSLEADEPKLKDVDVEQIQEQLIEQQMPVKRKEDHSPSTGFVEIQSEKDVNSQDCTSHEIPQLKSELTES